MYLLDTNVLVRLADQLDPLHATAVNAVLTLHKRNEVLHITAQNIVEFRNVATRPLVNNGLGQSTTWTEQTIVRLESVFALLHERPDIYTTWKSIVESLGVIGKQVHDARLVAVSHLYGITHILTFNVKHFSRLSSYGTGVIIVDPSTV